MKERALRALAKGMLASLYCRNILYVITLERQRKRELTVDAERISSLVDPDDVDSNHDSGDIIFCCLKFHVLFGSFLDQFSQVSVFSVRSLVR